LAWLTWEKPREGENYDWAQGGALRLQKGKKEIIDGKNI